MKAVVAAFNQEKALVGAFSVITNLRMELFQALLQRDRDWRRTKPDATHFISILLFVDTRPGPGLPVLLPLVHYYLEVQRKLLPVVCPSPKSHYCCSALQQLNHNYTFFIANLIKHKLGLLETAQLDGDQQHTTHRAQAAQDKFWQLKIDKSACLHLDIVGRWMIYWFMNQNSASIYSKWIWIWQVTRGQYKCWVCLLNYIYNARLWCKVRSL